MAKRYTSPITYRLREIPVKQIKVWKDAHARKLDREGIAELARSIKNEGLQNPPMAQKESKDSYLLMSGQRRLAALKRIGAKKIPVLLLTQNTKYDLENTKVHASDTRQTSLFGIKENQYPYCYYVAIGFYFLWQISELWYAWMVQRVPLMR